MAAQSAAIRSLLRARSAWQEEGEARGEGRQVRGEGRQVRGEGREVRGEGREIRGEGREITGGLVLLFILSMLAADE